jgi:hypothetical protein
MSECAQIGWPITVSILGVFALFAFIFWLAMRE